MSGSGSNNRQRDKIKSVRFSASEFEELMRRSESAGLSPAAYVRQQSLDINDPPPKRKGRAPRPETSPNSQTMTFSFSRMNANELVRRANIAGVSPASYIMEYCLDVPPPRQRHQSRKYLTPDLRASIGRLLYQLGYLRSEFGKIGSNLNQIARAANLGDYSRQSHETTLANFDAAMVDFIVMRSELMQALGDDE